MATVLFPPWVVLLAGHSVRGWLIIPRPYLLTHPTPPSPRSLLLQYLWTLKVTDASKATKLKQSLPPGLPRKDLGTK